MGDLVETLREALAGRYTFERELGRGGMATVYLARDVRHKRPVALKVLHPELAQSLGPERFQREIELAAQLQHPHILTVYDSGDSDGRLWFTMPYVEGESLRERLRRERQLPVDEALRIGGETARALDYAHRQGVIHRDIKPENILLTRDGDTLVADFGIARALAAGTDRLTETGLAVGTPAYMSPEQAAGDRQLDARTDVYALGAVLYEMLAGEPPFTGPTAQAIIAKRYTGEVPRVRQVRPSVPEAIEQAIQRALAPVAADRFNSAAQLAQALGGGHATSTTAPMVAAAPAPSVETVSAVASDVGRSPHHRPRLALYALALGFLVGLGVLFAWRRSSDGGTSSTADTSNLKRVAVLPFETLGDSADEYFSDGITDEVRGKLANLSALQVTARSSSRQYKRTTKSPQEIGRELGVEYLLTGTVRWEKDASGRRVRVSPELIQVSTGSSRWQQPFDASITDVFKVQADIAERVAQALDLALGSAQQKALATRPTANLAAYDLYLKGVAARSLGGNPVSLRQAYRQFDQAVALDSTFVAAWAAMSEAGSLLYSQGAPSAPLADQVRSAAERALALAPERPEGHRVLGDYYRRVPVDPARALDSYRKGLQLAPSDADVLRGLALAEQSLGQYDAAIEHFRRSLSLDPRASLTADALGGALMFTRRYSEALIALDHALALEPSSISATQVKAMVYLAQGDLAGARRVLAQPPPGVDLPSFVAYIATYWDQYWALDDQQQALLRRLSPSAFSDDGAVWGLALAGAYEIRRDMDQARVYADSARIAIEQQLKATPEDPQRLVLLGLSLAYLGRREDAIEYAERGTTLMPVSKDAVNGAYFQHQLARIHILLGQPDKALDKLELLLAMPYYLSPGWLKIDPTFDPLRQHPRFRKLVEGTS